MKTLNKSTVLGLTITLVLLMGSKQLLAMRCGNEIVDDKPLHEVQELCSGGTEYRVQNNDADVVKYYYEQDGMQNEMIFIDGKLQQINSNR